MEVKRFDIYWINLDPTVGKEIQKTRPCIIISPNELNNKLGTVIVAPVTSNVKPYPFRSKCRIQGKLGSILLDQIRTIDRSRLVKRIGKLSTSEALNVLSILQEMFAP